MRRLHPPSELSPWVQRLRTPQRTLDPAVGARSYRRRRTIGRSSQGLASIRSPRGRDAALGTCRRWCTDMFVGVARRIPGYRKQWMSPTDRSRPPAEDGSTTKLATASGIGVPPLTVWLGSAMYTFPVDRDVIVGRDRECDICFHDINPDDLTLISRVHAILRFDGGQWVVVDKSQNGIYVAGSRANLVPIRDRLSVALGGPRGPQLTFRVATSPHVETPQSAATSTERRPLFQPEPRCPADGPATPARAPSRRRFVPRRRSRSRAGPPLPDRSSRPAGPRAANSATIGRAKTNNIVVEDALASRVHAMLESTPGRAGDPRQPQQQRHIRQRHADQQRDAARRRRRHDRQHRPARDRQHAGPPARGGPHQRPDRARVGVDDRRTPTAAGRVLHREAGDADRGDRPVRGRKIHAGQADRRRDATQRGSGRVRRARRPRRVRVDALADRDGAAGRRRAPPAHRRAGPEFRRRTAAAAGHHRRRSTGGGRAGARRAGVDAAQEDSRRQAVRRSAQARIGGDGTADRAVAADPR